MRLDVGDPEITGLSTRRVGPTPGCRRGKDLGFSRCAVAFDFSSQ